MSTQMCIFLVSLGVSSGGTSILPRWGRPVCFKSLFPEAVVFQGARSLALPPTGPRGRRSRAESRFLRLRWGARALPAPSPRPRAPQGGVRPKATERKQVTEKLAAHHPRLTYLHKGDPTCPSAGTAPTLSGPEEVSRRTDYVALPSISPPASVCPPGATLAMQGPRPLSCRFSRNVLLAAPGWLWRCSLCLRLGSWSQGPRTQPRLGLPAPPGAGFPSPRPSPLCLPQLAPLLVALSQMHK